MIEKILASTVVSAIITGIILMFDNNRKNYISNITDERRKWREDIRKIVESLSSDNVKEKKRALIKLKPRLNAYGQGLKSYERDGHIWKLIEIIEKESKINNKLYMQLIDYLDLLLKFDWERSKREIKLNIRKIAHILVAIVWDIYFLSINNFNNINKPELFMEQFL